MTTLRFRRALCGPRNVCLTGAAEMFVIFSNRLGCFGSLILSVILTIVLILLLRGC